MIQAENVDKINKGSPIFTKSGEKIGRISEIFGPVSKPYISVKSQKTLEEGEEVYIGEKNAR